MSIHPSFSLFFPSSCFFFFTQSQHVEKGETARLSVVFQPRVAGQFQERIALSTNLGTVYYEVSGNAVNNIYDVQPLIGFRVPTGLPYSLPIQFFNPHDETVVIEEVSTSGSFLELSNTNTFVSSTKKVRAPSQSKKKKKKKKCF